MNITEGGCTHIPDPPTPPSNLSPAVKKVLTRIGLIILAGGVWWLFPEFAQLVTGLVLIFLIPMWIGEPLRQKELRQEHYRMEQKIQTGRILRTLERIESELQSRNRY